MSSHVAGTWQALPDDVAEWMGMPATAPVAPKARPRWFARLRRGAASAELRKAS